MFRAINSFHRKQPMEPQQHIPEVSATTLSASRRVCFFLMNGNASFWGQRLFHAITNCLKQSIKDYVEPVSKKEVCTSFRNISCFVYIAKFRSYWHSKVICGRLFLGPVVFIKGALQLLHVSVKRWPQ